MGITNGLALSWGSRVRLRAETREQSWGAVDVASDIVARVAGHGESALAIGVVDRERDVTTASSSRVASASRRATSVGNSGSERVLRATITGVAAHQTGGAEALKSAVSSAEANGHAATGGLNSVRAGKSASAVTSELAFLPSSRGGRGRVVASTTSQEFLGGVDVVSVVATAHRLGVTGTGLAALALASSVVGRLRVERVATSTLVTVLNTSKGVLVTSTAGSASRRSQSVGVEDGAGQESGSAIGPASHVSLVIGDSVWVCVGSESSRSGPNVGVTVGSTASLGRVAGTSDVAARSCKDNSGRGVATSALSTAHTTESEALGLAPRQTQVGAHVVRVIVGAGKRVEVLVTTDRSSGLSGGGRVAGRASLINAEPPASTTCLGVVTGTGGWALLRGDLSTETLELVVTVTLPSVLNTSELVASTSASSLARGRGHTISTGVRVGGQSSVVVIGVASNVAGRCHGGNNTLGRVVDRGDEALTTDLSRVSGTRRLA